MDWRSIVSNERLDTFQGVVCKHYMTKHEVIFRLHASGKWSITRVERNSRGMPRLGHMIACDLCDQIITGYMISYRKTKETIA